MVVLVKHGCVPSRTTSNNRIWDCGRPGTELTTANSGVKSWKQRRSCRDMLHVRDDDDDDDDGDGCAAIIIIIPTAPVESAPMAECFIQLFRDETRTAMKKPSVLQDYKLQ